MKRLHLCLALFALTLCITPSVNLIREAGAQKMDAATLRKHLVSEGLYSSEEVHKELNRIHNTPLGNPALAFEILIPKGWTTQTLQVSKQALNQDTVTPVPLLDMSPKGQKGVVLEVRYLRVLPEIALDRVLLTYAQKAGFQVVGRQRGSFNGRQVEEALLRISDPRHGFYLTRLALSRRGNEVFMVSASAKEGEFLKWARPFGAAIVSFSPDQN